MTDLQTWRGPLDPAAYPTGALHEPLRLSVVSEGNISSWWHEADGSRYRLLVVSDERSTLLCAGSGYAFGCGWALLAHTTGDTDVKIAWSYLAEKLRLKPGDRPGYEALIEAATGWQVF